MFSKSWSEMRAIDVTPYCDYREEKAGRETKRIPYLNWAKCVQLLHDNGAEVVMNEPLVNEHGSSLFCSDQTFTDKYDVTHRCYEVAVKITIDDIVFVQRYPLLNGINPVKDNSINQLRISNAQQRAFVKGVAIRTGLGFSLWLDGDETDTKPDPAAYTSFDIKEYCKYLGELVSRKQKEGKDVLGALNLDSMDDLRAEVLLCNRLGWLESVVKGL